MGTVVSREDSSEHVYPSNIEVTTPSVSPPKWIVNGKIILRLVQIGSLVTYLRLVGRSAKIGYKAGGLTATPVLYAIRELLDNCKAHSQFLPRFTNHTLQLPFSLMLLFTLLVFDTVESHHVQS